MKEFDPKLVTLSIGDGGNDVSMIMEAHIGKKLFNKIRNWSVWRRRNDGCSIK